MSTTSSNPPPARCSEIRFAEVDFPGVIQSRLVIEYSDGLKIIVGSHDDLHLAADLISELRRREGGLRIFFCKSSILKRSIGWI